MIYTSMNNERIKNIKKLKEKKYRDKTGLFLIEGDHLIKEAYTSKILKDEESFIEDFENDIDDEYNVYFKSESLTSSVYYTNDAIAGDTSICFESDGAYSSSIFEAYLFKITSS